MSSKEDRPDPCTLVIFGASGDLTRRKLFPALASLKEKGLLPENFRVIGTARSEISEEEFSKRACGLANVSYQAGGYDDPEAYKRISVEGNVIFYLSTPPSLYETIPRKLAEAGLLEETEGAWRRIVVEKPFGHDLKSATTLDDALKRCLGEEQLYRIDHYLGKETVQNLLITRFANSIFEPLFNRRHVDHVQISVLESVALEGRAGYYDSSGVLRDMVQNHLLQLLSLMAMEPPPSFAADRVRDEKVKVFRSLKPLERKDIVLGQYEGYKAEKGVAEGSTTPTYAALRVEINNWRWKGVPFYLRTGKALNKRVAEIAVQFKSVPHSLFHLLRPEDLSSNRLIFRIQPDEGITLTLDAKKPGSKLSLGALDLEFNYSEVFGNEPPPAYERLLLDCMMGDQTLFIRRDAIEETWSYLDSILDGAEVQPEIYAKGSSGPEAAEALLDRDGDEWRRL